MKRKRKPLIILTKQIFSLIFFISIFVIKFLDVLLSQPKGEEILTTTTTTERSISLDVLKKIVSL